MIEVYGFLLELIELLTLIAKHVIEVPLRLARFFEPVETIIATEADELAFS